MKMDKNIKLRKQLKLYEAETDRQWVLQGVSRYGNNNVFGAGTSALKGLK